LQAISHLIFTNEMFTNKKSLQDAFFIIDPKNKKSNSCSNECLANGRLDQFAYESTQNEYYKLILQLDPNEPLKFKCCNLSLIARLNSER